MAGPHSKALRTRQYDSPVTALGAGEIEVVVDSIDMRHWFAGVEFYSDSEGATVVTPTAGTSTYTVKSPVIPQLDQPIQNNVINYATTDGQVDFATNILSLKVVFNGLIGTATHAKLRLQGNPS